jgi:hypothetical protein
VEVRTKNIICGFVEGQTHVGMPRGAKLSLPFNEPHEIGRSSFIFKLNMRACTARGKKLLISYANQPRGNHRRPTPRQNL